MRNLKHHRLSHLLRATQQTEKPRLNPWGSLAVWCSYSLWSGERSRDRGREGEREGVGRRGGREEGKKGGKKEGGGGKEERIEGGRERKGGRYRDGETEKKWRLRMDPG